MFEELDLKIAEKAEKPEIVIKYTVFCSKGCSSTYKLCC